MSFDLNLEQIVNGLLVLMKSQIEEKGEALDRHSFSLYNEFKTPECEPIKGIFVMHYAFLEKSRFIPAGKDFISLAEKLNISRDLLQKAVNICITREYIKRSFSSFVPEPYFYLTKNGYIQALELPQNNETKLITPKLIKPSYEEELHKEVIEKQKPLTKTQIRNQCKALINEKIPEYLKLEEFQKGGFKRELYQEIKDSIQSTLFTENLFNEVWKEVMDENPDYKKILSKRGRRYDKEAS
jgi:hypothetical protein